MILILVFFQLFTDCCENRPYLISIDFYDIYSPFSPWFWFWLRWSDHISKHLEVRQKYSATGRIFKSLFGIWKCSETRYCYKISWNYLTLLLGYIAIQIQNVDREKGYSFSTFLRLRETFECFSFSSNAQLTYRKKTLGIYFSFPFVIDEFWRKMYITL